MPNNYGTNTSFQSYQNQLQQTQQFNQQQIQSQRDFHQDIQIQNLKKDFKRFNEPHIA